MFLKGKTFMLYINSNLNILHCEKQIELFYEKFTTPGELFLSDFSDIVFKIKENVSEFY